MSPAGGSASRTILHVDMDAFYVACEVARRPELAGLPVVVGGTSDRGVVAAASYEARRYGIRSATSSAMARRLCPQAVFLPGDHEHYAAVSRDVHAVFAEVTPLVEPIALDEAFLDVTGALRRLGDGRAIADGIRRRVASDLGLACSVGVAPSKLVAKLASKAAKPVADSRGVHPGPGIVVVEPAEVIGFLHRHRVEALWGVGPATLQRLHALGVITIGDLARVDERRLVRAVGAASGRSLHQLAQGIDDRPVEPDRATKSIGHEETFAHDRYRIDDLHHDLVRMSDSVALRLRDHGVAARTITVKVRFTDFTSITRSATVTDPLDTGPTILAVARRLLETVDPTPGVRLLGVAGSQLVSGARQLALGFDDEAARPEAWREASGAIDEIRRRFGDTAIAPAALVHERDRGSRPGGRPWGPDLVPDEPQRRADRDR